MQDSDLEQLKAAVAAALEECLPRIIERSDNQPPPRWLPPDEAAAYMGISRAQLFKLTAEGSLPCCKNGRKRVYDRKDLDAFWRKRKYKGNSDGELP